MGKTRKTNKHLPRRMYFKNGSHWFVDRKNKWNNLGADYGTALKEYGKFHETLPMATVNDLITKYEAEILPQRSADLRAGRRQQFKRIRKAFGHFPPRDVQQSDVWEYYSKANMTSQARHEVAALSAVIGWAVKWGALNAHPLLKMNLPNQPARTRYVSDDEYLAVRGVAIPMVKLIMDVALITAMRQADILDLERSQWTKAGFTVKEGKGRHLGKKAILFPVSDDLAATVEAALAMEPRVRRYVFCCRGGTRYTRDGFQSTWQRTLKRAIDQKFIGEPFTFHDIRAKSLSDTESLEDARVRAGHTDAKTTQRIYRRLPTLATVLDISHLRAQQ
jgi:integrase